MSSRWVNAGLLLALGVVALAVRLPYVQLIPAYTDEVEDIYRGLLTARGQLVPLTDTSTYIGSLGNWVVAGAFLLSGFDLGAPRTVALIAGVLTIPACYPLGKAWGGRPGGLLTAALMATEGGHVVVNSHVAWTNSATPLFVVLAVWLLWVGVKGRGCGRQPEFTPRFPEPPGGYPPLPRATQRVPAALAASGLCWGLALQTHPLVLALLPGAAIFLVRHGRPLLRTRWPYLAAALFVLVNLNLLVYNLTSGLGSVAYGQQVSADYARNQELTPGVYLERVAAVVLGLFQNLGGAVESRERDWGVLLEPGLWPVALLAAAGVVHQWRRGNELPALLLVGTVLVLPLFNGRFAPVFNGRYLAPLLPVLYAGIAPLGALVWPWLRARLGPSSPVPRAAIGLLAAFLVLHPLLALSSYYAAELKIGRTNAPVFQIVEAIKATRRPDEVVVIDRVLRDRILGLAEGRITSVLRMALAVNDIPFTIKALADPDPSDPLSRCRDQLVILAGRRADATERLIADLGLRDVGGGPARVRGSNDPFTLYRIPGTGAGC